MPNRRDGIGTIHRCGNGARVGTTACGAGFRIPPPEPPPLRLCDLINGHHEESDRHAATVRPVDRIWQMRPGMVDWDMLIGKLWERTRVSVKAAGAPAARVAMPRCTKRRASIKSRYTRRNRARHQ